MIINKYSNKCIVCGITIDPGDGFVFKNEDQWLAVCQGIECVKRACPEDLTKYKQFMSVRRQKEQDYNKDAVQRAENSGLFDYQVDGVKWITKQDNCLVADQMGLGKTAMALISLDEKFGALVVAPSHLKLNWRAEAIKWRSDLKVHVIKNKKSFRYPEPGEIVVTTYGLIPEKFQLPPKKRKNPNITDKDRDAMGNTVLIFDEVHALKNPKTIKFKKARELMKIAHKTIGLTGTPILNRELELWNMCRAIGIETKIFESFPRFLYLFGGRKGKYGYTFSGPKKETPKILRRAMLRRLREEVNIQLPDKMYVEIQVELPEKTKRVLDNAWDVYKNSKYFSDDELPPFEQLSKEKEELAKSKIDVLKKMVEDFEEKDILPIVFSAHQAPIEEIGKRKGWEVIKGGKTSVQKHKIKEKFQAGNLRGLAATIKAAGTGLTLTRSHHVIFNDLDWVPANNVQSEDRAARIGQEQKKVVIYHLVADHPLDRHIRKLILKKMALAHAALNAPKNEENYSSEVETEQDFKERVERVKKKEQKLRREAIVSRLTYWPTVNKEINEERAKLLAEAAESIELEENDARIVRLLKFAGLEGQRELRCLEAVLAPYEKECSGGFKKMFVRS